MEPKTTTDVESEDTPKFRNEKSVNDLDIVESKVETIEEP